MPNEIRTDEKACTKCGEVRPLDAFSRHRRAKDGRNWACKQCKSRQAAEWYQANRDDDTAKKSAYYRANKEKILARQKKFDAENPERARRRVKNAQLRYYYGISLIEYEAMLEAQGGHCRVCPKDTDLHVDHCHTTGVVRGILCGPCNQSIGLAGDDPDRLRRLAEYLEQAHAE